MLWKHYFKRDFISKGALKEEKLGPIEDWKDSYRNFALTPTWLEGYHSKALTIKGNSRKRRLQRDNSGAFPKGFTSPLDGKRFSLTFKCALPQRFVNA